MSEEEGIKLVHASLYRMGTMSMSEAYHILGMRPHHYHRLATSESDWEAFDHLVDTKWPHVAGAQPDRRKFTRADWEAVRLKGGDGQGFNFFTDFFSHFTPEIIRAYPEAKVVVVQREFDSWWPTYTEHCIDILLNPSMTVLNAILHLFSRVTSLDSLAKQYLGFFGVSSIREIDREKGRKAYDAFFQEIRNLVPPERRLEYKLSDGWEPLCKFLDKPVPDVPFPRLNSSNELQQRRNATLQKAWAVVGAVAVGAIAVVLGAWYMYSAS